jgi:hypothetical protein
MGWFLLLGAALASAGCAGSAERSARDRGPVEASAPSEPEGPTYKLAEEQKKYLWQVEHHGNLLAKHGFKPIAAALQQTDAAALTRVMADDFAGEVADRPEEVRLDTEVLHVVRRTAGPDRPPSRLGRDAFAARLLEFRSQFRAPPKAKLALMALRPTDRDDLDRPWEGTAQLRLWGERAPGEPCEVVAYLRYRTDRPSSANLDRGGWLHGCGITQSQVGHARRYLLAESAARRGIDPAQFHDNWARDTLNTITGGVYVCDFDRDGILDMLITDLNGYFLYRGLPGGTFENVTTRMGLPSLALDSHFSLGAAFVDLDGDGWEDLILGRYVFRNDGGKRFVNITAKTNLRLPPDASGVVAADYDRDGRVDLYVVRPGPGKASSWLNGKSGDRRGNVLLRNKGDWQFEDVTAASGTDGAGRSTFTAAWLDADNDGWPDLYVPNEFGNGVLYVNQRDGTFRGRDLTGRPCDFGTMGLTVGDVDNDGHIDVYCANMYSKAGGRVIGNMWPGTYPDEVMAKMRTFVTGSQLHLNKGGLKFEQKGKTWQVNDCGWAYGAALADLDNDGFLDLWATAGFVSRTRDKPDG